MKVPLFSVNEQNQKLRVFLDEAFLKVLDSGGFVLGEELSIFEKNLASYLDVPYVLGVSSGTDALLLALMALDIQVGDEVLCPAFTFFATAGSIARLGAIPVWVDVSLEDFCLDLKDAEAKISSKTKAILPVHLFGQSCGMDALIQFAQKHQLEIIEDVAQAIGSAFNDKKLGTYGKAGCFSFYPTKNLGGFGDSGCLVTNDEAFYQKAKMLRVHGSKTTYLHEFLGANFRMDTLQAALLNVKFKFLDQYQKQRAENAHSYLGALTSLEQKEKLILPKIFAHRTHSWNQFTIRVLANKRDALQAFLKEKGIGTGIYYPLSLDQQPCFQSKSRGGGHLMQTYRLTQECLSLPIYPELTEEQKHTVVEAIQHFFQN